jgi:uncharacterized protein (TIGR00255 family)
MLKSMTGFGKTELTAGNKKIQVEIRSLNSKSLDINLRTPAVYREKENEIRSIISTSLQRGKVDIAISLEHVETQDIAGLNHEVVKAYYREIETLSNELNIEKSDRAQFLMAAMRMPDSTRTPAEKTDDNEWNNLVKGILETIQKVNDFRKQEGKIIEDDLKGRINVILDLLKLVEPFEKARIDKYRERIHKQLVENFQNQDYDKNRFEQELIYYIEKIDITEEKVRLKNHCGYFIEMMHEGDSPGKKLGFITQEIGREINTLGSKANDYEIQKIVVQMKDELEKIKEQLMNVL